MGKLASELNRAVANNNITGASRALRKGADPDAHGPADAPPLVAAAIQGLAEMAKLLLAAGADPAATWQGLDALYYAVKSPPAPSRMATIAVLLEGGLKPDKRPSSGKVPAWWQAIEVDDAPVVELMLAHGARPDRPLTEQNFTPLMLAASHLSEKSVALLLEAGADPGTATSAGYTAMHFAEEPRSADEANPAAQGSIVAALKRALSAQPAD